MALETRLRGNGFVVEIAGLDLRADLPDETFEAVRQLWMRHKVAVFPGQDLSDSELMQFSDRFGPPFVHVRAQYHSADHPEVMFVSNIEGYGEPVGALGNEELIWHTDQSYAVKPVFGTLLYGVEIPDEGGDTWFADLTRAYEALPEDTKERIDRLRGVFSIEVTKITQRIPLPKEQRAAMPDVTHPLVRTHPYLGTKALYLSPAQIAGVEGFATGESEALLAELVAWAERPEFVYVHEWRLGDVVMWDNTQVMHRRNAFDANARRLLKRTGWHLPDELATPY